MTAQAKKADKLTLFSSGAAVIGLILYAVSSMVYPSKSLFTWQTAAVSVAAILLLLIAGKDKLPGLLRDILLVGSGCCLVAGISFFVLNRLDPAADIWFIPVNYPAAEKTSLYISCAGIALYVIAYLVTVVKAFITKD